MLSKPAGRLALLLAAASAASASLDLDPKSPDSIKKVSKTLAGGIKEFYQSYLEGGDSMSKRKRSPDDCRDVSDPELGVIGTVCEVSASSEEAPEGGIPGLFPDPYYWHEAGGVFNSLLNYAYLTGDEQYNDLIREAFKHQLGKNDLFMPPNQTSTMGNQDQLTWALGAMSAAEQNLPDIKDGLSWLDLAKNVFDVVTLRWDAESCNGGLRWQVYSFNSGYDYKDAGSNGLFFSLATRLAYATGNETYAEWASKSFDWMKEIRLVDQEGAVDGQEWVVNDGTDARMQCSDMNHIRWTWNHAVVLEGVAVMRNLTNGENKDWDTALTGLTSSMLDFTTTNGTNNEALTETACELLGEDDSPNNNRCNVDQRYFKGPALRSLHRATLFAPSIAEQLSPMLTASAKAAAEVCDGEGLELECALEWSGESKDGPSGGLGEANNALEAVVGLLWGSKGVSSEGKNGGNGGNGTEEGGSTESGEPEEATGAAGRMGVAWGVVILGAVMAMAGLA